MGWFTNVLGAVAAGYVAKRTHNSVSRPTVVLEDPEYEIVGLQAKGAARWEIRVRKKGTNSTDLITVNRSTIHTSRCGGISINWPD